MGEPIPWIDAGPLSAALGPARDRVDEAVARAASDAGFMVLTGVPEAVCLTAERRAALLRLFGLPDAEKRRLYRQRYQEGNPNRYRGLAPLRPEEGIGTENLDIGPDAVVPEGRGDPGDLLCERSPWPDEASLPGWRAQVAETFAGFEALGLQLLCSLERSWRLTPGRLADAFRDANSTLTLARHPGPGEFGDEIRSALLFDEQDGAARLQLVLPHTDSGCLTFVSQDAGAGLQARLRDGSWAAVPAPPGSLAVNFGDLLEKWTGGGVKATEHRVIGSERGRTAVVFFFEPAVAARIQPLPGAPPFEPVSYGDHVFERMQRFPDYQNLGPRFVREG